jgi:hypothetical protein
MVSIPHRSLLVVSVLVAGLLPGRALSRLPRAAGGL